MANSMIGPASPQPLTWTVSVANLTVVDRVPAEILHLVDTYWYQFAPLETKWHAALATAVGLLALISIVGNGCVIFIFSSTKSLRTPSNLMVINLAFADFMMMFTMAPPLIVNSYHETWIFGALMCEIYGMFGSLSGCVSIWSMTMIAYDRYNVIVKGLSGKPLTYAGYVPEGNMSACGTDYLSKDWISVSYIYAYSVFVYWLPLFLIIYCYTYILQAVSAHERNMREQAKKMNVASLRSSDASKTNAEIKLAKIALVTITLWFMAWTPYLVINYAGIFGTGEISPLQTIWGSVFAKANSVYNPIVYGISHPKYRAALYKRFPSLECGKKKAAGEQESVASGITTAVEQTCET
ncbi:opsin-1 [Anopheles darlingi]|uniref:Opsin-1 n=1 Tax=Anopheles darlingi TaxID=43151 RepID=W5J5C5_ANODA|nr:rhodopsin-like [Anopheles darlingi]ETN59672.1 opsin-1 [Anopheles darlingi]